MKKTKEMAGKEFRLDLLPCLISFSYESDIEYLNDIRAGKIGPYEIRDRHGRPPTEDLVLEYVALLKGRNDDEMRKVR